MLGYMYSYIKIAIEEVRLIYTACVTVMNWMCFPIETLVWEQYTVKGEAPVVCAGQTFISHHDKVKEVYFTVKD